VRASRHYLIRGSGVQPAACDASL